MNVGRETILAIIIGLIVGATAAWGVWKIPKLSFGPQTQTIEEETPPPEITETFLLNITQPENEAIVTEKKITIEGKTTKGAIVIISSPVEDQVFEASGEGKFALPITLEEGLNNIAISAYYTSGTEINEKLETRAVTYTQEEL
jgi:hypothetical protein